MELFRTGESANVKKRNYNTRLIKRDLSYTIQEVAELYGLHPQAVRRWINIGLRTIDGLKPFLIHGSDLINFLNGRQSGRKQKCQPHEFYCCRCRLPRRAQKNEVKVENRSRKLLNLSAVCEACDTQMNKAGSVRRLHEYRQTFTVQTAAD